MFHLCVRHVLKALIRSPPLALLLAFHLQGEMLNFVSMKKKNMSAGLINGPSGIGLPISVFFCLFNHCHMLNIIQKKSDIVLQSVSDKSQHTMIQFILLNMLGPQA